MKEMPTLFQRDFVGEHTKKNLNAIDKVEEGCEWVINGEGTPTQKFDGSACLVRNGVLYRRLKVKPGNTTPDGWLHWSFDPDQNSGHGWALVGDKHQDIYHQEAWACSVLFADGTYELCGPMVQGNPENLEEHELLFHGSMILDEVPTDFNGLRDWLATHDVEGIVWHHPDGRMVKLKQRDFGLTRPKKGTQP